VQRVVKGNRLKDGAQLVVPVRTDGKHPKGKIDFRESTNTRRTNSKFQIPNS